MDLKRLSIQWKITLLAGLCLLCTVALLVGSSLYRMNHNMQLVKEANAGMLEDAARARDALSLYVRRIVREIGALVAVLGGLDLLVFTAGVGEHSPEIRRRVCESLGFLPLRLDAPANLANAPVISAADSEVIVGVEPTNEEWVAARAALTLCRTGVEA